MNKEKKWPVTLKVDIEPEGLKRVVGEGRLMEFVDALSTLASEHIKVQLVEELAKGGAGLKEVGRGISIDIGFDIDDPYGTPPRPWPWPKVIMSAVFDNEVRNVVRQEFARMR